MDTSPTTLSPEQEAERKGHIGGSEIASLFGIGYQTALELFLEKTGQIAPEPLTAEWIEAGIFMEPATAAWVQHRTGYRLVNVTRYHKHPTVAGWGASLDYEIVDHPDGLGVAELKWVNWFQSRRTWQLDVDEEEAPPHIELQLQHQFGAATRAWGLIGANVSGSLKIIERAIDAPLQQAIADKVGWFMDLIRRGDPPEIDLARDLDTLKKLWPRAVVGKVIEAPPLAHKWVMQLEAARVDKHGAEGREKEAQTALYAIVGDAEGMDLGDGRVLTAKTTERDGYIVAPTTFRSLRVTKKKERKV